MTVEPKPRRGAGPIGRRSRARLAASQALYQILLTDVSAQKVIEEFQLHRREGEAETCPLCEADLELFADIVRGAAERKSELEARIGAALAADWPLERLDSTLRAILWAGAYELAARPDIPFEVVVNEYMNVAHAFFADKEPAFVNGVLDRLARELRPGETEAAAGGGPTGIRRV